MDNNKLDTITNLFEEKEIRSTRRYYSWGTKRVNFWS